MKISDHLNGKTGEFLTYLYGSEPTKLGDTWKLGDYTGATGDSLTIWQSGAFKDFATGDKGDLVILASLYWGKDIPETCARIAAEFLGIESDYEPADDWELLDAQMEAFQRGEDPTKVSKAPKPIPEKPAQPKIKPLSPPTPGLSEKWEDCPPSDPWTTGVFKASGTISVYRFVTADNKTAFLSARLQQGKDKSFRIAHFYDGQWIQKAPPMQARPLYNLPNLMLASSETPVIVVEGEKKCVKAAKEIPEYLWTTWHGGSGAIDKYDLRPLEGRKVIIWPDNDDPGTTVANRIAEYLGTRARVIVLRPESTWAKAADVADILDEFGKGYTLSKIKEAIDDLPESGLEAERVVSPDHKEPNQLGSVYRFIDLYGHEVKYLLEAKDWMHFDGRRWVFDRSGFVWRKLRNLVERTIQDCGDTRESRKYFEAAKNVAHLTAIENGAKRMEGIGMSENDMDKDAHLLNVRNGVIDLTTGKMLPHNKGMMMSKICEVDYEQNATAPEFHSFLKRIMCGSDELVDFLQAYFGYSLTGLPPDRIFAIFYGSGRNGKSTLTQIISQIMGDYHVAARVQSIMQSGSGGLDKIGEDMIPLRGARLATMQEAEKGMKLNEGKLKELTGRDKLKCRYLHSNIWLEWTNTAKLILSTNHRPRIQGTDSGIWDRVALVPFNYRITDDELDPELADRIIQNEASGVLRWLVEGAVRFFENGRKIHRPEAIRVATEDYQNDEDVLGRFFSQCIAIKDTGDITAKDLYICYKEWMEDNQDNGVMGSRNFHEQFNQRLASIKGVYRVRRSDGYHYTGIRIKDEAENDLIDRAQQDLGEEWNYKGEPLF